MGKNWRALKHIASVDYQAIWAILAQCADKVTKPGHAADGFTALGKGLKVRVEIICMKYGKSKTRACCFVCTGLGQIAKNKESCHGQ